MSRSYRFCLALAPFIAALACEHDARLGFACPGPSATCWQSTAADSGGSPTAHADTAADGGMSQTGTSTEPLGVSIVNAAGAWVAEAELACDSACLDVVARATGGEPPYSFEWDDARDSPERSLCPDAATSYTVRVRDRDGATTTAVIALTRASCTVDAGASVPSNCRRFSVGEYMACGNVGAAGDMPQLRAAQPHTLRIHSNLATDGTMQVTAVADSCSFSEPLGAFSLPTGPAEESLCLTPSRDSAALMITVTSGGSAAFLTNLDSYVELCDGCE